MVYQLNTPTMSPNPPNVSLSSIAHSLSPSMVDPSSKPTMSPFPSEVSLPSNSIEFTRKNNKRGLIINKKLIQTSVEHYNDHASWFYNYLQTPYGWQEEWADKHNIEFVPMIPKARLNHENGTIKCVFHSIEDPTLPFDGWTKFDICTVQDAIDVLANSIKNHGVEIKYLMGFNEMYNNPRPKGKDLTPFQAAYFWRVYVQPAAIANGLELVSPTVGGQKNGITWFAKFLKRCFDKRKDPEFPCDIDLIKKFALHHYNCEEERWKSWFGGDESRLMRGLTAELGKYGGKKDWDKYLRGRAIWVTETNCYWEVLDNQLRGFPHPSSKEQCLRVTGQKPDTHGKGSLATMEELDNIERYAWWTTWNPFQFKPNYLTYADGQLSPVGRAYMRPGDTSVDCDYNDGDQMDVTGEIVDIDGAVDIVNCQSTGTALAR